MAAATPDLLLIDPGEELVDSWDAEFAVWPGAVRTVRGRFEERLGEFEAIVSPGNSYGQMDGGIDGAISRRFPAVQRAVWGVVADRFHGYQPVGTAAVVATGDAQCRWLVYAPTMRVPMPLHDGRDVAVHDALWAALLAIDDHNATAGPDDRIRTAACPGFGTGVGRVPAARAAHLMAAAYGSWRAGPTAPISAREDLLAP